MAMHKDFAEWYRSAAVTVPPGQLEQRWAAVEAVAQGADRQLVVDLAKLFVLPGEESHVPAGLREAFRKADEAFPSRGNVEEMRVLAGAILHYIVLEKSLLAPVAALALVTGCFGPRGLSLPHTDHLDAARSALLSQGRESRLVPKIPDQAERPSPERLATTLPPAPFQNNQLPQVYAYLQNTLLEFVTALGAAGAAIDALSRRTRIQGEELNIVWWLQNAFSRDLQKAFRDVGYEGGSLIFSSELADLTELRPGPDAVPGVLLQALRIAGAPSSAEAISIGSAVNATPREWREKACREFDVPKFAVLCPLHLGLRKSLDTDGREDWYPVFRKVCDIPVDQTFDIANFSIQMYNECLLLLALKETG